MSIKLNTKQKQKGKTSLEGEEAADTSRKQDSNFPFLWC